jgi:hypothetical protein
MVLFIVLSNEYEILAPTPYDLILTSYKYQFKTKKSLRTYS